MRRRAKMLNSTTCVFQAIRAALHHYLHLQLSGPPGLSAESAFVAETPLHSVSSAPVAVNEIRTPTQTQ